MEVDGVAAPLRVCDWLPDFDVDTVPLWLPLCVAVGVCDAELLVLGVVLPLGVRVELELVVGDAEVLWLPDGVSLGDPVALRVPELVGVAACDGVAVGVSPDVTDGVTVCEIVGEPVWLGVPELLGEPLPDGVVPALGVAEALDDPDALCVAAGLGDVDAVGVDIADVLEGLCVRLAESVLVAAWEAVALDVPVPVCKPLAVASCEDVASCVRVGDALAVDP